MRKPTRPAFEKPSSCLPGMEELPPDTCEAVGDVLSLIGNKWSILIVASLAKRTKRFTELKHELAPVSQKVLTSTLRGLEQDGYITRTVVSIKPSHVTYDLTDCGHDVLIPVTALAKWAYLQKERVWLARKSFALRSQGRPRNAATGDAFRSEK